MNTQTRRSERVSRPRESQIGMLGALAKEARRKWAEGRVSSAYDVLQHTGWLYRMTMNSHDPTEREIWALSSRNRFRLLIDALDYFDIEHVLGCAERYLNYDMRRKSQLRHWEWATAFARDVVAKRDHFQVAVDSISRIGVDLIIAQNVAFCARLGLVLGRLAQLDQLLCSTPENELDTINSFHSYLFVSPEFDLSYYWWFGPERRQDPERTSRALWEHYQLPEEFWPLRI